MSEPCGDSIAFELWILRHLCTPSKWLDEHIDHLEYRQRVRRINAEISNPTERTNHAGNSNDR